MSWDYLLNIMFIYKVIALYDDMMCLAVVSVTARQLKVLTLVRTVQCGLFVTSTNDCSGSPVEKKRSGQLSTVSSVLMFRPSSYFGLEWCSGIQAD